MKTSVHKVFMGRFLIFYPSNWDIGWLPFKPLKLLTPGYADR